MNNQLDRLLIVDDEEYVRQYLATVSRRLDFDVAMASDRQTLERQLVSFDPDVILLDLQMPGEDGINVLKLLKNYNSRAKIILVSGMDKRTLATAAKVGESLGLNMDGALQKPVLMETLRDKLRKPRSADTVIRPERLEDAIANGEIRPAYQAKAVRKSDGRWAISEAEALARWHRPESEVVFPSQFLTIAEHSGLLPALTDSMLEQVVLQLRDWENRGLHLSVAVNVSSCSLTDATFPDRVEELMRRYGFDNSRLILELTESAAIQNKGLAMEILSRLRIKGFGLSIDDFGTGYSSLEQLYRMPFSELKVDRFLVREVCTRSEAGIIVKAVIKLAKELNIGVCAEGVETADVVDFLLDAGCEKIQGYFLGRPSSAEALETLAMRFQRTGFGPTPASVPKRGRAHIARGGVMPRRHAASLDDSGNSGQGDDYHVTRTLC